VSSQKDAYLFENSFCCAVISKIIFITLANILLRMPKILLICATCIGWYDEELED